MAGLDARVWASLAVTAFGAAALVCMVIASSSQSPAVLMDYNYPAQYALMQGGALLVPVMDTQTQLSAGTVYYFQCAAYCNKISSACVQAPQYADYPACNAIAQSCKANCQGSNLDKKVACMAGAEQNYHTCIAPNHNDPESIKHCKFLFMNGVQSC